MQLGTFIKTPSPIIAELLALAGLDFAIIDAEHGPFGRAEVDALMIGGRAAHLPLFVRVPDAQAATLLWALDVGAAGLVVPHVDTAAQAADLVANARFKGGRRGFSNSARFGRYGTTTIEQALELGDQAQIFCQIESGDAVRNVTAIARTPGVDGLVIGRADLALSLGETRTDAPAVLDGTRRSIDAARAAGIEVVIVTGRAEEAESFIEMGATMAVIASDQAFLRMAAGNAIATARPYFCKD